MSRFSGKCDFCDYIESVGLENVLKSKVYVGGDAQPLALHSMADCVPYFPYVISRSFTTQGTGTIYLMSKSWVDIEEARYGHMKMHDYYRQRLKEELDKITSPTPDDVPVIEPKLRWAVSDKVSEQALTKLGFQPFYNRFYMLTKPLYKNVIYICIKVWLEDKEVEYEVYDNGTKRLYHSFYNNINGDNNLVALEVVEKFNILAAELQDANIITFEEE